MELRNLRNWSFMRKININLFKRLTKRRERRKLRTLRGLRGGANKTLTKNHTYTDIIIPAILDLNGNRSKLINLLNQIQDVILNKKRFRIDHREMKKITKEALLLLTSEIERCTKITKIKLKANYKLFPKDTHILNLLNEIGYWDYFIMNSGKYKSKQNKQDKLYLKIVGDTQISGEKIGKLIEFFEKLINFERKTKDKFSDALMEAAANTVEHAYKEDKQIPTIKKWWLTASLNKNTNEISFIFYDQGLGILNTLEKTQKHIKLKRLVAGWINEGMSKGGILKKLITSNLSSYKDERRGNGLISFKTFIDEVESGELIIYTDDVSYSAISDQINNYDDNLNGTLIVWKIKANCNSDKCIYIKENNNG